MSGAQGKDPNLEKKADIQKAILESVLGELREELKVLDQDGWIDDASEQLQKISDRPEWLDVVPEALQEPQVPVVAIEFDEEYRDVLGLLRAMIKAGETSHRALWISAEAIKLSSANYSAWDWHWRCWEACGHQAEPELQLMQQIASDNPKNYQLWNFRRRFAVHRGAAYALEEMEFAADCLRVDAKNYHAWGHRHAMLRAFGLWGSELELTDLLLQDDPYNNSAWSQRHAAFTLALSSGTSGTSVADETDWTCRQILRAPRNWASWNYMRSLTALPMSRRGAWQGPRACAGICHQVLALHASCAPAWGLLAFVLQMQLQKAIAKRQPAIVAQAANKLKVALQQLCVADPTRAAYWTQMAESSIPVSARGD
ncbi:hypothetical protein WJX84_000659 [Apatococcus fuscideae]|uniref:Protein farnesyltransferase/geranylgeranyltransferase type-1 subunit alpha n=1 Tax=Apatococcus fuscideae TaxID=2026836 RepID=A0AAW1T7S5_9CHLO